MAKNVKAQVRGVAVPIMAWASFACAFLAGVFAPGMWLGHAIVTAASALGWFTLIIFFALLAWTIRDLSMDGEPNKVAVYSMIVMPTLAASVPGTVGAWIAARSQQAGAWASTPIHNAVGDSASTVLTLVLLAIAVVFAQRTVKGGSGKGSKTSIMVS